MNVDNKPLIVTIDDDPMILRTILNILKDDYEVRPFASGGTALKYMVSSPADLVLLDYSMPEMNGFEVMERLQKNAETRDVPVLFLTGKDNGDSEVLAIEKGAEDYLLKPIEPKVLLTRVRHQLELRQYRQNLESLVKKQTEHLTIANERLKLREDATLSMLAMATDLRDHHTGSHIWRTPKYVRIIIDEMRNNPKEGYNLTQDQADDIIKSTKLHDLGKIAIPDHILGKPGRLTAEEFEMIKRHPLSGAEFLDHFIDPDGDDPFLSTARDIALYHHEKWDGSGYPTGRKGEEIPLSARIVAIADVYDALISVRPYKLAYTHEESVSIISGNGGRAFDPYLVRLFTGRADSFRAVSREIKKAATIFRNE